MRSRNIKPGFFKNEILGKLDPCCCIFFAGLWCMADREGRLECRPERLRVEILPYRTDITEDKINGYLTVLSRLGFTAHYNVEGNTYIQLINFKKHQSPHHTEKQSQLPEITEDNILTVDSPLFHGGNPPDSLIHRFTDSNKYTSSLDEAEESNGDDFMTKKKRKLNGKRYDTFKVFWDVFDYKEGKAEAADAWLDIPQLTNTLVERIVKAATIEARRRPELKKHGKTPKMAQGWITGRRWEDEMYDDEKASQPKIIKAGDKDILSNG